MPSPQEQNQAAAADAGQGNGGGGSVDVQGIANTASGLVGSIISLIAGAQGGGSAQPANDRPIIIQAPPAPSPVPWILLAAAGLGAVLIFGGRR